MIYTMNRSMNIYVLNMTYESNKIIDDVIFCISCEYDIYIFKNFSPRVLEFLSISFSMVSC